MSRTRVKPYRPIYPSPAALITSVDGDGKPNVLTLAEVFNISIANPVIVGIAIRQATYSYGLIVESREFVINLPTAGMLEQVDKCGSVSGRDGFDKFSEFGLKQLPAAEVQAPLIKQCPVNIECRVRDVVEIGDHDLITGDVLAVHVDDKCLEDGKVRTDLLEPLAYGGNDYWSIGRCLGAHGFSAKTRKGD